MRGQGFARPAGVDEVGRGPLAGPVVAAAVILPADWADPGVADSKALSEARRRELAPLICAGSLAWALGWAEAAEVDGLNIHHASLVAMRRAVMALAPAPDCLLVDGRFCLPMALPQQAVVKGDARCRSVAAASILAKVHRDSLMDHLHRRWPVYNFAANKGYATAEHRRALADHGPCPEHRKSFGSVAQLGLFGA
ncbi:MAG: ribonuclease HII [Thermodesulfobacteriota bacterium]